MIITCIHVFKMTWFLFLISFYGQRDWSSLQWDGEVLQRVPKKKMVAPMCQGYWTQDSWNCGLTDCNSGTRVISAKGCTKPSRALKENHATSGVDSACQCNLLMSSLRVSSCFAWILQIYTVPIPIHHTLILPFLSIPKDPHGIKKRLVIMYWKIQWIVPSFNSVKVISCYHKSLHGIPIQTLQIWCPQRVIHYCEVCWLALEPPISFLLVLLGPIDKF